MAISPSFESGNSCTECYYGSISIFHDAAFLHDYDCKAAKQYLTKQENRIMTNVVKRIKNLTLSKDDKLLRKYGLIDECGDLTEDGDIALTDILFTENKDKLVAIAEKLEVEDKASKK